MSDVIEFRGAGHGESPKPRDARDENERHAEAFRDLESGISDCVIMASIAVQMAAPAIEGRDDKHEKAMFAVFQVADMLKKLKADYYAAWHGERRST
jgi:hypothetical protein